MIRGALGRAHSWSHVGWIALRRDPWRYLAYAVIVASAFSASLGKLFGVLSFRPDWAVAAVSALLILSTRPWTSAGEWKRQRHHPIAISLVTFVAVHVAASLLNAGRWLPGLKFMNVYVLGLAAFLAVLHGIRNRPVFDVAVKLLIGVAALASVWGAVAAVASNLLQQTLFGATPIYFYLYVMPIHAGQGGLVEPNILGSFLLVPLALALWGQRDEPASRFPFRAGSLVIVGGLAFAQTRAAWLGAATIVLTWLWLRRPPLVAIIPLAAVAAVSIVALQSSILPLTWAGPPVTQLPASPPPAPSSAPSPPPAGTAVADSASSQPPVGPAVVDPAPSTTETSPTSTPPQLGDALTITNLVRLKVIDPLVGRFDYNLSVRRLMNAAVFDNWRAGGPMAWLAGRGSGSTNGIEFVLEIDRWPRRLKGMWTGNALLMTLHDAGIPGLAAFVALIGAVAYQLRSMFRRASTRRDRGLCQALTVSVLGLVFAYQFTHALWQMWTYVLLGLVAVAGRLVGDGPRPIES